MTEPPAPTPAIVPRWEWRVFGDRFRVAEEELAARTPSGIQDSDEVYLLGQDPGFGIKVRDELLDIKQLLEVDADGLERWVPVLKAPFPLSGGDIGVALAALGLPPGPALDRLTLEDLAAGRHGPVRVVRVHKHRVRYRVGGCLAESSELKVDGQRIGTLAVEGEDQAAVVRTLRMMGLGGYPNTSYPSAITDILDPHPARSAVIDVGTNSVKLCVGERGPDARWRFVVDRSEITRLGEGLADTGSISDTAATRVMAVIGAFADEARRAGATRIEAVGTAGLRQASNATAVIASIAQTTGIRIQIISGEEESRLAYVAAVADLPPSAGSRVVFDTGGGSTQLTFGHADVVDERVSLPVGAVRYTERFGLDGPVDESRVRDARRAIAADLASIGGRPEPESLVGIGGAVTNLVAMHLCLEPYDPDAVQGARLEAADIERWLDGFRPLDLVARRRTVGLQPGRAEVIVAGACVVLEVMALLGRDSLITSSRGLRHGVIADRQPPTPTGPTAHTQPQGAR